MNKYGEPKNNYKLDQVQIKVIKIYLHGWTSNKSIFTATEKKTKHQKRYTKSLYSIIIG